MLTTGAVLSAESCVGPMPTRLLMTCTGPGIGDRADWEARPWDRSRRKIDESGVGAGEAADRAVGACAGRAGCGRGIDAAEIRPNEAADEVVVAVSGDGAQRRCKLDRAEIYAGKPAQIAL